MEVRAKKLISSFCQGQQCEDTKVIMQLRWGGLQTARAVPMVPQLPQQTGGP